MTALARPLPETIVETGAVARRRGRMEAWKRRSRLIQRLRKILPASIGAILVLLTGWVLVRGWITHLGDRHTGGAPIHMTNARFYGRDGDGRAFVLAAQEASRDTGDIRRFTLVKPALTFDSEALKPTQIAADHGLYREDVKILRLEGHVVAKDSVGDTFWTSQAIVDTQSLVVNGWNKVRGEGPSGLITADAYGIYDHGRRVVFSGNVHSIIKPD